MSRFADRREDVRLRPVLAEQPRLRDRRVRRVAQLAEAAQPGHVPQVRHVEQAVDLVELALVDLQRVAQLLAQPGAHLPVDLQPDDLAEAAPAKLLLDRLQQVVGLVGDVVVGVAGDPEERVVGDLHPGEQRAQVGGDQVLERDQRGPRLADLHEPPEQLLRHLHPGEHLGALVGIAERHGQAEREVRDVGERAPEADRQRASAPERCSSRTPGRAARARRRSRARAR